MVDQTQQYRQQIQTARQQLQSSQRQIAENRRRLSTAMAKRSGDRNVQLQRRLNLQSLSRSEQQLRFREKEILDFEKQINIYEAQQQAVAQAQAEASRVNADIQAVKKAISSGDSSFLTKAQKRIYSEYSGDIQGLKDKQLAEAISSLESQSKMSLSNLEKSRIAQDIKSGKEIITLEIKQPEIISNIPRLPAVQTLDLKKKEYTVLNGSTNQFISLRGGVDSWSINRTSSLVSSNPLSSVKDFTKETVKEIGKKIKQLASSTGKGALKLGFEGYRSTDVGSAYVESRSPEISTELTKRSAQIGSKQDVATFGAVAGTSILWEAPVLGTALKTGFGVLSGKQIVKTTKDFTPENVAESILLTAPLLANKKVIQSGVDFYRTFGKTEIPVKDVVAPEYLSGKQKYPTIKKGTTAGELLSEFKPMLAGETKPAGYTALTKKPVSPLISGSSELKGFYQAPKLSATFLRLDKTPEYSGKPFSLNLFGTLTPTAVRTTPTKIELVPQVNPSSQVNPSKLKSIQLFFRDKAELGKSYIPFIKTEKEAIIPEGTELVKKPTRYYFTLDGRKVPVLEYEAVSGIKKNVKTEFIGDVVSKYSSRDYKRGFVEVSDLSPLTSSSILVKEKPASYLPPIKSSSTISTKSSTISTKIDSSIISTPKQPKRTYPVPQSPEQPKPPIEIKYKYPKPPTRKKPPIPPTYKEPPYTTKLRPPIGGNFGRGGLERTKKPTSLLRKAYDILIKRKGKFELIGKSEPLGSALKKGTEASKKTLSATFKLVPKGYTRKQDVKFKVPTELFREYKIRKGKKIATPLEFIEKRGKRLSTKAEVSLIQFFKRKAKKKRKFLWS